MKTRRLTTTAVIAVTALALAGALTFGACGGSDEGAAPAATTPAASPSVVPAAAPESQLDGPGDATLAQTKAAVARYASALTSETIPTAGVYAADATWDFWPDDNHMKGATQIESMYADAAEYCDWAAPHIMSTEGAAVSEGVFTVHENGTVSLPSLALLAVDGKEIVHEEVFLDPASRSKKPVTFETTAPGPKDTAAVAADVASAVGDAFAAGDVAALQTLLAPDVLFYDTSLRRGAQGVDAVLAWQAKTPTVEVDNQDPIAGRGWAVVRWTVRRVYDTGVEVAMPGATVMEVRDGKVVRLTLYYDSELVSLQS
jgi:ketosteroid isomerase-like protein